MRVLIVKTSSLGDLIHTFPALNDAHKAHSRIEFHWLVEDAFTDIPSWHPAVQQVLPIGWRRWRKRLWHTWKTRTFQDFYHRLRAQHYDLILDAQGLLKSALPARLARGPLAGLDWHSAREPLASLFYSHRYTVPKSLHAILRLRQLFAQALDYDFDPQRIDYGLSIENTTASPPYIVFLHGTTWPSKLWPESRWIVLARLLDAEGYQVHLPWKSLQERARAERIIQGAGTGKLLSPMSLSALKMHLAQAAGAVGVDTGLAHLAAAVNTPAVTLYGATNPQLTGVLGPFQRNLQVQQDCAPCLKKHCPKVKRALNHVQTAPCYQTLDAQAVWQALHEQMQMRT